MAPLCVIPPSFAPIPFAHNNKNNCNCYIRQLFNWIAISYPSNNPNRLVQIYIGSNKTHPHTWRLRLLFLSIISSTQSLLSLLYDTHGKPLSTRLPTFLNSKPWMSLATCLSAMDGYKSELKKPQNIYEVRTYASPDKTQRSLYFRSDQDVYTDTTLLAAFGTIYQEKKLNRRSCAEKEVNQWVTGTTTLYWLSSPTPPETLFHSI